jgi:hypothetical protein
LPSLATPREIDEMDALLRSLMVENHQLQENTVIIKEFPDLFFLVLEKVTIQFFY